MSAFDIPLALRAHVLRMAWKMKKKKDKKWTYQTHKIDMKQHFFCVDLPILCGKNWLHQLHFDKIEFSSISLNIKRNPGY